MNSIKILNTKTKLSTLWIVIMFEMAYADILSAHIPGTAEELLKTAGDTAISLMMLAAAVILQIPILMIFLSRFLKFGANCWANIIAGVITIAFVVGGGSLNPHYILIGTIEVICALLIIWTAWKWKTAE